MKWATEEEVKSKTREIEALKSDLKRSVLSREDALESQRRELTATFESLIAQRDDSFLSKERDVSIHVAALESRFDTIQTENMRLKSELHIATSRGDLLGEEAVRREEYLRQITWRLDEERRLRMVEDETIQARAQDVVRNALSAKEDFASQLAEYQRKLDKVYISNSIWEYL